MPQKVAWWSFFAVMLLSYLCMLVLFFTHLGTPILNRLLSVLELLAVSVVAFFFGSGLVTLGNALFLARRSGTEPEISHEPER
ncbi:MAG: hypothetical protein NVSMB3_10110 [Acidobacteriaceae bacterium]